MIMGTEFITALGAEGKRTFLFSENEHDLLQ